MPVVNAWRETKVLVIDEVSMLSPDLFDLVDAISKAVRCSANVEGASGRPFGGLQLIICGDFLQLPPVSKSNPNPPYCFESKLWAAAGLDRGTCILQTAHRQLSDPVFTGILNELRRGVCSTQALGELARCHVKKKPKIEDGIVPTRLYCTNRDVDTENAEQLAALPGQSYDFNAYDEYDSVPDAYAKTRLEEAMEKRATARLRLKVGAQV